MRVAEWVWAVAMLAGMAWWVRRDMATYHRFLALTDTADRQRAYRAWVVQSFVVLVGASIVCLGLTAGWRQFGTFPTAFAEARQALRLSPSNSSGDALVGAAIGMGGGLALLLAIQWWRLRRAMAPVGVPADALLPRNRREAGLVLLLSLNAGFAEELFFRLALPLLLLDLTGSVPAAFVAAGIAFGLAHAYQGWKGIAGTALVGAMLTLMYLGSGSLLRVMLAHAAIDVVALLVRPALTNRLAGQRRAAPAAA